MAPFAGRGLLYGVAPLRGQRREAAVQEGAASVRDAQPAAVPNPRSPKPGMEQFSFAPGLEKHDFYTRFWQTGMHADSLLFLP